MGLIPLTDADVKELAEAMRRKALATDQRILVSERLGGHSLTCRQAGVLLQTIKLGLMQRILAFEVLQGRLSDLPDGLPYVLEPLSGSILRRDVEVGLQNPQRTPSTGSFLDNYKSSVSTSNSNDCITPIKPFHSRPQSPTASVGSSTMMDNRKPGWESSVDRLRARVNKGNVAPEVYEDLAHVFEALGLGPLQGQPTREHSGATSDEFADLETIPSSRSVLPGNTSGHLGSVTSTADILQDLQLPGAPIRPRSASSRISEESV